MRDSGLEALAVIVVAAGGVWLGVDGGAPVVGAYLLGILLIVAFCATGFGLAMLSVWLEERAKRREWDAARKIGKID